MSTSISIVIPALNEEEFIGSTLTSINNQDSVLNITEVVVIDNGSTDETVVIAKQHNATVFTVESGSVGELRNYGVSKTTGEIIIFIDADITLTDAWHNNFPQVLDAFAKDELLVTGSHCHAPDEANFLERYWFSSFEGSKSSHLGTGHLIMKRELFNKIGGFTEGLATGEDYDICMKAVAQGGHIEENQNLVVIHNDFPANIWQFVIRESWHGAGDLASIKTALGSKVVQATSIFLLIIILLAWSILTLNPLAIAVTGTVLSIYLLLISAIKFNNQPVKVIFINAAVYFFYFSGRALALIKKLIGLGG